LPHSLRAHHTSAPLGYPAEGPHKRIAFVFDIDGVLIRGPHALPHAAPALHQLDRHNVPWILLTNGGGRSEQDRVDGLSALLGTPIHRDQFIQSHTPLKPLAAKYKRVLVVGGDGDRCRRVAEDVYGFSEAIITADIVRANPSVWPFHRYTALELETIARPNFQPGQSPIDAVLVFNDPRDMGTDLQIVLDVLLSDRGHVGTRRAAVGTPNGPATPDAAAEPSVPIFFSNNDLLWANPYPVARFGQGAFRVAVEALYAQMTHGAHLQSTIIGKPHKFTYDYANSLLLEWAQKTHASNSNSGAAAEKLAMSFDKVFMVGDNPASDITGANAYGWDSLLVRTGVFQDEDLPGLPKAARPTHIFDHVGEAVEHGLSYAMGN
jgi:HAD superfamily hydrolase (TIGR01456 family)